MKDPNATFFAPAALASDEELARSIRQVAESPLLTQLLEAVGITVMILNPERQVVALNQGALKAAGLGPDALEETLGLRPGESLGCVKLSETPNGCGTGNPCATCGISRAIMDAQLNHRVAEYETMLRLNTPHGEVSHEYLVRVSPLEHGSTTLLIFTLQDIADKKRREHLERVFFHDLLNTLSALSGYRALTEQQLIEEPRFLAELGNLIERAMEEVKAQRSLVSAEHERLTLNLERFTVPDLLDQLLVAFEQLECRQGRSLEVTGCNEAIETDRTMLLRVLTNMLKNALEATPPGGTVRIRCTREEHSVLFAVKNPGKIPDDIAHALFARSFSTKAESGHGIGTYSMKLFGERYLRGKIAFTTDEAEGTEFTLRLPLRHGAEHDMLTRLRLKAAH